MQTLAARKAQRTKQRNEAEKARNTSPSVDSEESVEGFDAAAWVADSVENIVASLHELDDAQLLEVEAAEGNKKKRVGVMNAIADDRKRRESNVAGWNTNAG